MNDGLTLQLIHPKWFLLTSQNRLSTLTLNCIQNSCSVVTITLVIFCSGSNFFYREGSLPWINVTIAYSHFNFHLYPAALQNRTAVWEKKWDTFSGTKCTKLSSLPRLRLVPVFKHFCCTARKGLCCLHVQVTSTLRSTCRLVVTCWN